jgi:hypothetical protein
VSLRELLKPRALELLRQLEPLTPEARAEMRRSLNASAVELAGGADVVNPYDVFERLNMREQLHIIDALDVLDLEALEALEPGTTPRSGLPTTPRDSSDPVEAGRQYASEDATRSDEDVRQAQAESAAQGATTEQPGTPTDLSWMAVLGIKVQ